MSEAERGPGRQRRPTSSSKFGVGKRESHDSSAFYARFNPPELSSDSAIGRNEVVDEIYLGDARDMSAVADDSVALVVTSPPYFVGKEYEEELGSGHVPRSYLEYLELLEDVFAECVRVLEPGGRIAVNVANLGRRPYRSLSADVIGILQDRLRLLLRGEVIWQKGVGASGSCAWGSFQSPQNPVLRDISERVVLASKGRFDRALSRRERFERGLPADISIFKDEFMEATLDVWDIPPESATRVNHPAPFPVELPKRLIELFTFQEDVVLDPFSGSGSTAVAAVRTGRHYLGFELDPGYRATALERIEGERRAVESARETGRRNTPLLRATPTAVAGAEAFSALAVRDGARAKEVARALVEHSGFKNVRENRKLTQGVEIDIAAEDARGRTWFFDVSGAFSNSRGGLRRMETLWRVLGKAALIPHAAGDQFNLILLTTELPAKASPGERILRSARGHLFHDVLEILSPESEDRLARYAAGDGYESPIGDPLAPFS